MNPATMGEHYYLCARCGSDVEWFECEHCGGEGETAPGELHEEDPLWYDEDDSEPCHQCGGAGGWRFCLSPQEWCEANPMKGQENTKRGTFQRVPRSPR